MNNHDTWTANHHLPATDAASPPQPLLKVYVLGPLRLEWQVPPMTQETIWSARTSARALFLLLLFAPHRQANRSYLAGILWPETEEHHALESLRSALKVLRKVLSAAQGEVLIAAPKSDLLQLADQSHLWVDVDAFLHLVEQASQQTDGEQALPLWQQARLLLGGGLLEGEQNREWARHRWIKLRHKMLSAARRRMVHYLARCLLETGQRLQAETLLSEHVIRFPTDQDALLLLMKLLIAEYRFEEAHQRYEACTFALEAVGKRPAEYLRTLAEQLHTLSIATTIALPPPAVLEACPLQQRLHAHQPGHLCSYSAVPARRDATGDRPCH